MEGCSEKCENGRERKYDRRLQALLRPLLLDSAHWSSTAGSVRASQVIQNQIIQIHPNSPETAIRKHPKSPKIVRDRPVCRPPQEKLGLPGDHAALSPRMAFLSRIYTYVCMYRMNTNVCRMNACMLVCIGRGGPAPRPPGDHPALSPGAVPAQVQRRCLFK